MDVQLASRFTMPSASAIVFLTILDFVVSQNSNSTGSLVGSSKNGTQSGTNLWCYECFENYVKVYTPSNSPCLTNLSVVTVRQCSFNDQYCKVERLSLHGDGDMISMQRGCVVDCNYGCRYNGYGLTLKRCTSCCRSNGCNIDNSAPNRQPTTALIGMLLSVQLLKASWSR